MVEAPKKVARKPRGPRAKNPIQVPVTDEERAVIIQTAKNCGLPVSALLRRLALGYQPPSLTDINMELELIRLRGDFGRLGGLLKMWLVDAPGKGLSEEEVRALLRDTEAKMEEIISFLAVFRQACKQFERQK